MNKTEMINELYFSQKKTLTEIADIINISISYISRILRNNENYVKEKENRKKDNLEQRRKVQKEIIYNNRKKIVDTAYIDMKNQHIQASRELSKRSTIGNQALRKWCSSAYRYNGEKNRYEFDTKNLSKPIDFPLYIKQ